MENTELLSDDTDSESSVASSLHSEHSEYNVEDENEDGDLDATLGLSDESESCEFAYAFEPMADEDWLKQYEKEREEDRKLQQMLNKRLKGQSPLNSWCSCGKCNTGLLENISECYCCKELDGCSEALETELVQKDLKPGQKLKCITEHPGFRPVCLEKWSLRMAADRFRTKSKEKYKQKGSEESYLRSIAYREFSRLVYGFLGKKRIPLPACAYNMIRKEFPCTDEKKEKFTGFEMDEQ